MKMLFSQLFDFLGDMNTLVRILKPPSDNKNRPKLVREKQIPYFWAKFVRNK